MSLQTIVMVGFGLVIGLLVLVLGLVAAIRGFGSARNAALALFADETPLADVDTDEDAATVKLAGTVEAVPDPVETADGDDVAVYNLKAVAKNWKNLLSKRKDRKWLLAEGARLDRAVVDGAAGEGDVTDGGTTGTRWELTADPVDEDRRWGGVQTDSARGYGALVKRPDLATGEWTNTETYTDAADLPDHLVEYLESEFDADVDVDVSKSLVSLAVAEDEIGVGDEIRIVGKVQPRTSTERADAIDGESATAGAEIEAEVATDGGTPSVSLNLTPGATVTGGSWWTLAWTETKSAVKLPAGLVLIAMGLATPVLMLAQVGVLDLGLGL